MKKITIFDTTLRDGEQAPGNSMSIKQKLTIALQLEKLGVNTIEAGFPAASLDDFKSVFLIASKVSCKVCAFARSKKEDIDKAGEALKNAKQGQIEILGSGSDMNLKYKREMTRKEGLMEAKRVINYARRKFPRLEISFGLEDASRGDIAYLKELSRVAVRAGANVIVIGDTVGYAIPKDFDKIVYSIKKGIPKNIVLSVHCHNDLGLAVANSVAGIENGATEVQVTVNGIGERCGNTQLEAFVMVVYTHSLGQTTIKTELLYETSQLVSKTIGRMPSFETPIVGENAFATEAGMHQAAIFKNPITYQIFDPKIVGRKQTFVIGHHSGKKGIEYKLREFGFLPSQQEIIAVMKRVKNLKKITDSDLKKIYKEIKC